MTSDEIRAAFEVWLEKSELIPCPIHDLPPEKLAAWLGMNSVMNHLARESWKAAIAWNGANQSKCRCGMTLVPMCPACTVEIHPTHGQIIT